MPSTARTPIHIVPVTRRRALTVLAGAAALAIRPAALAARQGDLIRVTTTVGMVADAAKNIGGDRVDAAALMGPGIDPHLYSPGASDINALGDADIILYVGLELEGRMIDTLEQITRLGIPTIAVGEAVPDEERLAPPEYEGAPDPHIWFSVPLWKHAVEAVRDALIEHFPDDADVFETNAAAYEEELDDLDAYVRERTESVPERYRVLITAHDAFGYFGTEYGYDVRGIQGLSTATEAGAGDIRELADFITEREIPAIFVETSVPPATIEALQEATRSRGWDVAIGGELFSDAMGAEGTPEGTYVGMVTHNIDTIVAGLTGEAAES
jgi:manganese/zinc/iron transport system substrate-binding protein